MTIPFRPVPARRWHACRSVAESDAVRWPALGPSALMLVFTLAACSGDAPLVTFPPTRPDAKAAKAAESPAKAAVSSSAATGAVSAPSTPSKPPEPPAPPKPTWRVLLEDGIERYENGAYAEAIVKLEDAADNADADKASRVKALKYLAFSYCVSPDPGQSRKSVVHLTQCRQAFERALTLDPTFELTQTERGHPVWGKQFQAARMAQSKKNPVGKRAGASTAQPASTGASKGGPASASGASDGAGRQ